MKLARPGGCPGCWARWWTMARMMTRSCRPRCEVRPIFREREKSVKVEAPLHGALAPHGAPPSSPCAVASRWPCAVHAAGCPAAWRPHRAALCPRPPPFPWLQVQARPSAARPTTAPARPPSKSASGRPAAAAARGAPGCQAAAAGAALRCGSACTRPAQRAALSDAYLTSHQSTRSFLLPQLLLPLPADSAAPPLHSTPLRTALDLPFSSQHSAAPCPPIFQPTRARSSPPAPG